MKRFIIYTAIFLLTILAGLFLFSASKMKMTNISPIHITAIPFPLPPPNETINLVNDYLSQLSWGQIIFNTPEKMNLEDTDTICLILDNDEDFSNVLYNYKNNTKLVNAKIKISDQMDATLTGSGFKITSITPSQQVISLIEPTIWKWEIKPIEKGKQNIYLTINIIITVDGDNLTRTVKTFEREIQIKVTAVQSVSRFFKDNWQWLWATLIPVAGGIWKFIKYRKKRKASKSQKPKPISHQNPQNPH